MYLNEDKVSELLKITRMQLRFILEADDINYKWFIKDNIYYISGNSLVKLQNDIKQAQIEFEKSLKDYDILSDD